MTERAITKTETQSAEIKRPETFASPAVDIFESDAELLLKADMPGVSKPAIKLRFENETLYLEGHHRDGEHVFRRSFGIDTRVDSDAIRADLDDGVLTVHLPKAESAKPREIAIQ